MISAALRPNRLAFPAVIPVLSKSSNDNNCLQILMLQNYNVVDVWLIILI